MRSLIPNILTSILNMPNPRAIPRLPATGGAIFRCALLHVTFATERRYPETFSTIIKAIYVTLKVAPLVEQTP